MTDWKNAQARARSFHEQESYGLWQIRTERTPMWHAEEQWRYQRSAPRSDHYRSGYRAPYRDPAVAVIRARAAAYRNRERWWHSWAAFSRYHKRMWRSMLNEQHYACLPLMDLREAARLPEPNWRERHWRGLYVAKWAGGVFLFLELLRV